MKAKCWIYKRATLFMEDGTQPTLIHYTDGTREFTGNVHQTEGGVDVYMWNVGDQMIAIPLNIAPQQVTSIVKMGSIPYTDMNGQTGEIKWECIFGKYRTFQQYYMEKLLPFLILIILSIAAALSLK